MEKYAIGVDIGGTKCSVVLGEGHIPDNRDRKSVV